MLQVLIRFLTFNVMSEHPGVYWGLAAVWLILLLAAFSSLRSLPISTAARIAWFGLIFFVPLIGLGIYALRCLFMGDWRFFKPFLLPQKTTRKIASR